MPGPLGVFPVVALVGSAGSVTASATVLAGLPSDLAAAVIVLIHQSPSQGVVILPDLLRSTSRLPVTLAVDGLPLMPSHALVIPPGKHMVVDAERRVRLIVAGAPPPNRPSADLLLSTLAMSVGSATIAVVLSGNGHDGATGATAVHHVGGSVITTDEASSEVFSMPSATINRDHIAPMVVGVEALPGAVRSLVGELTGAIGGDGR